MSAKHLNTATFLQDSPKKEKRKVTFRAKTFAGHEQSKTTKKTIIKKELGEVIPLSLGEDLYHLFTQRNHFVLLEFHAFGSVLSLDHIEN